MCPLMSCGGGLLNICIPIYIYIDIYLFGGTNHMKIGSFYVGPQPFLFLSLYFITHNKHRPLPSCLSGVGVTAGGGGIKVPYISDHRETL